MADASITCPLVCADTLRAHWQDDAGLTVLDTAFDDAQTLLSVWSALRARATAAHPLHIIAMTDSLATLAAIRSRAVADHAELVDILCQAWPPAVPGFHRLLLDDGKVVVTLVQGGDADTVAHLSAAIDVFYIKPGFAGRLTPRQAKKLGQLARPRAALLASVPDDVLPRDVLAVLAGGGFVQEVATPPEQPAPAGQGVGQHLLHARYLPRWPVRVQEGTPVSSRQAIVIGAGLAGAAIAERLTVRGWDITVLEAGSAPAQQASGNLGGIYMPMVSQDDNPASRFNRAAYVFAQQLWAQLGGIGHAIIGEACGVLQVARDDNQQAAFRQAANTWGYPASFASFMDSTTASGALGMATRGGWLFPQAGWLRPSSVCDALFAASRNHAGTLSLRCATAVEHVQYADGIWTAIGANGTVLASAPTVVLANGMGALAFAQAAGLPLSAIRGQVSHVPAHCLPTLPYVLCGDGYMTRAYDGIVSVGATYGGDTGTGVTTDDQAGNMAKLQQLLPGLDPVPDVTMLSGRVGLRCVTPDRMPLIGALPAPVSANPQGVADKGLAAVTRVPGLYGLLGYASRGLITAPLAAEMLACQLTAEVMPVGRDLQEAVDPARFVLRTLRKGRG